MNPASPTPAEAAQWIAGHLAAHPRATDTAEGIRRWWLAPRHGEVAEEIVDQALAELERRGVVTRRSIGSRVIYGAAAASRGGGAGGEG